MVEVGITSQFYETITTKNVSNTNYKLVLSLVLKNKALKKWNNVVERISFIKNSQN